MFTLEELLCFFLHRTKDEKKKLRAIKNKCNSFFVELVSGLCFGQSSVPEDKLIQMLLNIVFTEGIGMEEEGGQREEERKQGTRYMTPYKDDLKGRDEKPVIRSFLLQLLLEHR